MTPLQKRIRELIQREGVIPFDRFMEIALYDPQEGYYERNPARVGRTGDFYTSPATGQLFGELLAFRFASWLERLATDRVQLIEAGAHSGQLAQDILQWIFRCRPALYERLEYWIIEPSANHRDWQSPALASYAGKIRWLNSPADLPDQSVNGMVFSNELLDAMPVRRFGWNAPSSRWFEWGVGVDSDDLNWAKIHDPENLETLFATAGMEILPEILPVLPDGFTLEISTAASQWWEQIARKLRTGTLMTNDYGLTAEEFIDPKRQHGTLRAYYRHRIADHPLAQPGLQDLTVHVNFTQLQRIGESHGLRTEIFQYQSQFLTAIVADMQQTAESNLHWSAKQRRQFQTLTHPDHLGRAFRILAQTTGGTVV